MYGGANKFIREKVQAHYESCKFKLFDRCLHNNSEKFNI
jgi:hypothetical protein